jgi:hypothetical protein
VPAGDLASKLYPLREAIEKFADSAAHPREVENREEFKQAVALLSDPAVPLDVVAEYALGNNWALSSAAFAAFGRRPDRQAALALILPRLPNIGAWPLYFALAFVDGLDDRPPVGETLVRISEHAVNHGLFPQLYAAVVQATRGTRRSRHLCRSAAARGKTERRPGADAGPDRTSLFT